MKKITRVEIEEYFQIIDREHEKQLIENGYLYIPLSHITEPLRKAVSSYGLDILKKTAARYEVTFHQRIGEEFKVVRIEYAFPSQKEGFQLKYVFHCLAYPNRLQHTSIEEFKYEVYLQKNREDVRCIAGHVESEAQMVEKTVGMLAEVAFTTNTVENITEHYPISCSFPIYSDGEKTIKRPVTLPDTHYILFYDTAYKPWMKEVEHHIALIKERIEQEIRNRDAVTKNKEKEMHDIENEYLLDNK